MADRPSLIHRCSRISRRRSSLVLLLLLEDAFQLVMVQVEWRPPKEAMKHKLEEAMEATCTEAEREENRKKLDETVEEM